MEAKTFVGDVANMGVGDDMHGPGSGGDLTRNITYRDTASTVKTITLMAVVSGQPMSPGNMLPVEFVVNGQVKEATAGTGARDPEGGMLYTSGAVMATFKNVSARDVNASIRFKSGTATDRWLRSPTMIITRGSGSFSYS